MDPLTGPGSKRKLGDPIAELVDNEGHPAKRKRVIPESQTKFVPSKQKEVFKMSPSKKYGGRTRTSSPRLLDKDAHSFSPPVINKTTRKTRVAAMRDRKGLRSPHAKRGEVKTNAKVKVEKAAKNRLPAKPVRWWDAEDAKVTRRSGRLAGNQTVGLWLRLSIP